MPAMAHLDLVAQEPDERGQARRCLRLQTSGELPSGESANVIIHNASISGLLIETALPLSEGEQLLIDLPHAGLVNARAVWRSGQLYGCRFEEEVSQADMSALELRSDAPFSVNLGAGFEGRGKAGASLGKRIEQLRKARGLTLADLADSLGVSKPTVWAWEKGKARPIEERIPALALALDVEPSELAARTMAPALAETTAEARRKIAAACGISEDRVRIMIDL